MSDATVSDGLHFQLQRPCALGDGFVATLGDQRTDDGGAGGVAHHVIDSREIDPPNGDRWQTCRPDARREPLEAVESDGWFRVQLARRAEDGTERDVVGPLGQRGIHVGLAVRGDADQTAAAACEHLPRQPPGQIALADMDAIAFREQGEVHPIVGKERHPTVATHRSERSQAFQHCSSPAGAGLVTQLKRRGTRREHGFRKRQQLETDPFECRDVGDGVQPAHEVTVPTMKCALLLPVAVLLHAGVASASEPAFAPSSLGPVPVTLRLLAPSAKGQWLLRLDNEGDAPALVSADVRLLRLEVRKWDKKRGEYAKKGEVCDGPATFGLEAQAPFGRELVLEPGQSYVEAFDPRLLCFGKQAELLEPGVMVMPSYGFAPRAQVAWKKVKEPEVAPFVADTARGPRTAAPAKRLVSDSLVLSDAAAQVFPPYEPILAPKGAAPSSAEAASRPLPMRKSKPYQTPKDGLAAAMSLTTDRFADANAWQDVAFEVEAHNVGERPIWAALRARQLSFMVYGNDSEAAYCPRVSQDHEIPRDMYEQLPSGKHRHIAVNLAEPCAGAALQRPGLYAVVPTLHADPQTQSYGLPILSGTVTTRDPGKVGGTHHVGDDATLVRVRTGPQPFYPAPPRAVPTKDAPSTPKP